MQKENNNSISKSRIPVANNSICETEDAAKGIHRFFDVYHLPAAIGLMESILEASTLPKVWQLEQPADGLCFIQHVKQLIAASYAVHNKYPANKVAIKRTAACLMPGISHTWETFPRSLTAKQYAKPYYAISECCSYMPEVEWKQLLHDITECALSNTTLYEMQPECNILRVRRYLLRLLEACYLVHIQSDAMANANNRRVRNK